MKKTFQGLGILSLLCSFIFLTSNLNGSEITLRDNFDFLEKESDASSAVSKWQGHLSHEGLIERRHGSGEITDHEKIPTDASNYYLFASYQNLGKFTFLITSLVFNFLPEKDLSIFYRNLKI